MADFTTKLGSHFHGPLKPAPVTDTRIRVDLLEGTRQLVWPFLSNTDFWLGRLDASILTDASVYTVWRRRDKGDVPYSITELAADLADRQVDRDTISEDVEAAIRHFASTGTSIPANPVPVIIEDCMGEHLLVLEGNRRLTGLVLGGKASSSDIEVYAGHTWLSWWAMLARLGMSYRAG